MILVWWFRSSLDILAATVRELLNHHTRPGCAQNAAIPGARSFPMEALGLPLGNVNLALNPRSRAGFTLQPPHCIRGDVIPSEAILLWMGGSGKHPHGVPLRPCAL